jgi:capsular polysaccharide export protein
MKHTRTVEQKNQRPRVFGFSLSFFTYRPLRRVLATVGVLPQMGWPRLNDAVLVWGRAKTAGRGMRVARFTGADLITVEDGFLRSVKTGRQGEVPMSLIVDRTGIYFETAAPNDLRDMLRDGDKASADVLSDAEAGLAFVKANNLSKYNDFPLEPVDLPEEFILVVDQTLSDASIAGAGADADTFAQMLDAAIAEHPNTAILIKTHPESMAGKRQGYFDALKATDYLQKFDKPVSPWVLLRRAKAIYCVSSQLGMEAIFAGHRPVVFGNAFYSGLGLSDDRHPAVAPIEDRSVAQLFASAMMDYCKWYDPFFDRITDFWTAARMLAVKSDFARLCQRPQIFVGMRLWKRGFLRRFFSDAPKAPRFIEDASLAIQAAVGAGADIFVWSGKETDALAQGCAAHGVTLYRVEDGFLRSAGLGAELIEPVSLALDDLGIYYDPTRESRMERLVAQSVDLPAVALERARSVRLKFTQLGLSKYNLSGQQRLELPLERHCVLVPGQVEDDQSILKGAGRVRTNVDLVRETKTRFPDSYIIFKPHPDVLAGLRDGGQGDSEIARLVDQVIPDANIAQLLYAVDCVSTITSLTGFEALLRGKQVVCFGVPFYSGWGLTEDFGDVPARRRARATLDGLVHAALVDYPRYWDPVSGKPCPIEVVLERFERGEVGRKRHAGLRVLAKVQGMFASYAYLWR